MDIGFGKPEDGIRLHITLGEDLKSIYFTSKDEIPKEIAENLHTIQSEILDSIRAEISRMISSAAECLNTLDEALSDSAADEELLFLCNESRRLSDLLAAKLEKINAH